MTRTPLYFFENIKYQTADNFSCKLNLIHIGNRRISYKIANTEIVVSIAGNLLQIDAGFGWDGPSGPTVDTDNTLVASLKHDALCLLMRQTELSEHVTKSTIDKEYINDLDIAGMTWFRRMLHRTGLKTTDSYIKPENKRKVRKL